MDWNKIGAIVFSIVLVIIVAIACIAGVSEGVLRILALYKYVFGG
jgi:hypothetical protein